MKNFGPIVRESEDLKMTKAQLLLRRTGFLWGDILGQGGRGEGRKKRDRKLLEVVLTEVIETKKKRKSKTKKIAPKVKVLKFRGKGKIGGEPGEEGG